MLYRLVNWRNEHICLRPGNYVAFNEWFINKFMSTPPFVDTSFLNRLRFRKRLSIDEIHRYPEPRSPFFATKFLVPNCADSEESTSGLNSSLICLTYWGIKFFTCCCSYFASPKLISRKIAENSRDLQTWNWPVEAEKVVEVVGWSSTLSLDDERQQIDRPNHWSAFENFGLIPVY